MWQDSPEVNPNILIWSLTWLVFCHTEHFHRNCHKLCIYVHKSPQVQNKQVAVSAI